MSTRSAPGTAALRALIARATLAPSPRNAQPWRWTLHPDHVQLEIDPGLVEQLASTDPGGRELVMSCGAALLTLRVAAAEALFEAQVDVLPDPHRPHLLACVTLTPAAVDAAFSSLDAVVPLRRTAWGAFDGRPLPAGLTGRLRAEALAEGVILEEVPADRRGPLADLVRHADHDRCSDAGHRAELLRWIASRWSEDGRLLPAASALTRTPAHRDLGDQLGAHEVALLLEAPYAAVLATQGDGAADWLAGGQGLQRLLLVAAAEGVLGGFLNSPCQVEADRARLRDLLPDRMYPQAVIRLGYPLQRPAASARRPVDEVVTTEGPPEDGASENGSALDAGVDFTEDTLG
jgi:nitroreductase